MFTADIGITASKALEISSEKEKDMESQRLHHVIKAYCSRFWKTVRVRQEDYHIIDVKEELTKAGVPFKENHHQSYDCDLTHAKNGWFIKAVKQRNDDIRIIISSVTACIESEAKKSHRHCTWGPDANHQDDYNWEWLIKSLEANGFSACINDEGDIRIDW